MDRTIRITGKAKLSVKPDQIIFTLIQTELKKSFEEANIEAKKQRMNWMEY